MLNISTALQLCPEGGHDKTTTIVSGCSLVSVIRLLSMGIAILWGLCLPAAMDEERQIESNATVNSSKNANTLKKTQRRLESRDTEQRTVVGKVEFEDGTPANGATVIAVRIEPSVSVDARVASITDARGEFTMQLNGVADKDASWRILAVEDGSSGTPEKAVIVVASGKAGVNESPVANSDLTIRLKPGKLISGRVFDKATQQPLANAGTKIFTDRGEILTPDLSGRFEVRGVTSSEMRLLVTSPGRVTTTVDISLAERASASVDIMLDSTGVVAGQVLTLDGQPIANATVERGASSRHFEPVLSRTTDADGRFSFDGFPAKTLLWPLSVRAAGFEEAEFDFFSIRDPGKPTSVVLRVTPVPPTAPGGSGLLNSLWSDGRPPRGVIRGRVVDAKGNPVRNFIVGTSYRSSGFLFSDDDGRFVRGGLDVDREYSITVTGLENSQTTIEKVWPQVSKDLTDNDVVEFRLQPPSNWQVLLTDAQTELPIRNVMLGMRDGGAKGLGSDGFSWNLSLAGARTEWTSDDGRAEFNGIPGGEALVFVDHPGYARQYLVRQSEENDSKDNKDSELIEMELQKEARLRVRLLYPKAQNVGTLYMDIRSQRSGRCTESSRLENGMQTIDVARLSPGKNKFFLTDRSGIFVSRGPEGSEIDLQPGDNDVEIAVPLPAKPVPKAEQEPPSLLEQIRDSIEGIVSFVDQAAKN